MTRKINWIVLFLATNLVAIILAGFAYLEIQLISTRAKEDALYAVQQSAISQLRVSEGVIPDVHGTFGIDSYLNQYNEALGTTGEILLVQRLAADCQILNTTKSRAVNRNLGVMKCTTVMLTAFTTARVLGTFQGYHGRDVFAIGRRFTNAQEDRQDQTYILVAQIDTAEINRESFFLFAQLAFLLAGLMVMTGFGCWWGYRKTKAQRKAAMENQALLDGVPSGIIRIDATEEGVIRAVNPAMLAMFGYDPGEMIGQPVDLIIPDQHKKAHYDGVRNILAGGEPSILGKRSRSPVHALRKDGSQFPVSLTVSQLDLPEGQFYTGVMVDMTEEVETRHKIERRNEQLRMLAKTSRHDVLNNIGVANTALDYIEAAGYDAETMAMAHSEIKAAIELLQASSQWVRVIEAGDGELELEKVSLNDLVEKIRPEGAKFVVDELRSITCNPGLMQSVFRNLFENSIRHCPGTPEIYVEREYQTIKVIDNAGGFGCVEGVYSSEYAARLMELGQRGNEDTPGTGMGLASCVAILDAHGFGFRHLTTCGQGTCWYIDIK